MPVRVASLPYATDAGPGARARIGLIAAAADTVVEHDFTRVIARIDGVGLYTARYSGTALASHADARSALGELVPASRLLLPGQRLSVVALACGITALTTGEDGIETMFRASRPDLHVVTPTGAMRAALSATGMRHVGVLTSFGGVFNAPIERALARSGIEVGVFGSFDEERDTVVGAISETSIRQNVLTLAGSAAIDGFVILGGQLRASGIVGDLERELGLPVIASGQALVWHALRSAGITDRVSGCGLLFDLPA